MHTMSQANQVPSEYAEVTQIMPKINTSAPPEPYATVSVFCFVLGYFSNF